MDAIKEDWPFLLKRKYLLIYAGKLGFSVDQMFEEAVRDKIPQVFSFFREAKCKQLRKDDLELQTLVCKSFKIPYSKFPESAIGKLGGGLRPTSQERRLIVQIAISKLLETTPARRKFHIEPIAKEIVEKYPLSFEDYVGTSRIGEGHSSLLNQLIARVENCRRGSSHKRALSADSGKAPKRVSAAAKYGCIDYQPTFPEGESEETFSAGKKDLIQEFRRGEPDYAVVDVLMDKTYPLQRLQINEVYKMDAIKEDWPFLFKRKYLLLHAEKLIGFSVEQMFEEAARDKIPHVFSFFQEARCKELRDVDLDHQAHLKYIPALAAYFQEDCNIIFKIFEENKSLQDVQIEAPVTPFIACIGDPYQLDPICTVFVDRVPLEPMIPINDALHTWFIAFYVFNLVYPEECCATLEFIQRALLSINPNEQGSKMAKLYGKRSNIHPKVLKLTNKLRDFDNKWHL